MANIKCDNCWVIEHFQYGCPKMLENKEGDEEHWGTPGNDCPYVIIEQLKNEHGEGKP